MAYVPAALKTAFAKLDFMRIALNLANGALNAYIADKFGDVALVGKCVATTALSLFFPAVPQNIVDGDQTVLGMKIYVSLIKKFVG